MTIRTKMIRKNATNSVVRSYESQVKKIIAFAGQEIRNIAVQSIHQASPAGNTYEKYSPRRTHTAARKGNPPNTDTGYLANNINMVFTANRLGVEVESRAEYSAYLELGWTTPTGQFVQFPFLVPATEEVRPKVRKLMRGLKAKGGIK